jgi:hypothetical protein
MVILKNSGNVFVGWELNEAVIKAHPVDPYVL